MILCEERLPIQMISSGAKYRFFNSKRKQEIKESSYGHLPVTL